MKFFLTEWHNELGMSVDNVSLDFLKKENEDFPCGNIKNVKKNEGMQLVVYEFLEVPRPAKGCFQKKKNSKLRHWIGTTLQNQIMAA
jgi:hypothetical protein